MADGRLLLIGRLQAAARGEIVRDAHSTTRCSTVTKRAPN
jgi:hypothetical protein